MPVGRPQIPEDPLPTNLQEQLQDFDQTGAEPGEEAAQFNDDEVNNLREIFDLFDKQR